MKNVTFNKKCNPERLTAELKRKGFDIYGVSTEGDKTIVHLKDMEKNPPSIIVGAHILNPARGRRFLNWLSRR